MWTALGALERLAAGLVGGTIGFYIGARAGVRFIDWLEEV